MFPFIYGYLLLLLLLFIIYSVIIQVLLIMSLLYLIRMIPISHRCLLFVRTHFTNYLNLPVRHSKSSLVFLRSSWRTSTLTSRITWHSKITSFIFNIFGGWAWRKMTRTMKTTITKMMKSEHHFWLSVRRNDATHRFYFTSLLTY